MKIALPLNGKMSFRSFHTETFIHDLRANGITPHYFIPQRFFKDGPLGENYSPFDIEACLAPYAHSRVAHWCSMFRKFVLPTESTRMHFKNRLFDAVSKPELGAYWPGLLALGSLDLVRHFTWLAPFVQRHECKITRVACHAPRLKALGAELVFTPGVGSEDFLAEAVFAREAQRMGLPVVSGVSNYDNVVGRGYPGFMPTLFLVWSRRMAEDAMKLMDIPAQRIVVTGPVQFDRYAHPLKLSREEFLRAKGLDPSRKTLFYAGSPLVTSYYDFLKVVQKRLMTDGKLRDYNVVVRPTPHAKVLSWHGMTILKEMIQHIPGMYYSDPQKFSPDSFMPVSGATPDAELDELHYLFRYSDVLVNQFSTVSLEAAINDLPVIHIGYDDFTFGLRYTSYVKYCEQMTHNRREDRLKAARIARSEDDLVRLIDQYMTDRTLDQEARRHFALLECEYLDGKSGQRTSEALHQVVRH